jgi:hypothetical protein
VATSICRSAFTGLFQRITAGSMTYEVCPVRNVERGAEDVPGCWYRSAEGWLRLDLALAV